MIHVIEKLAYEFNKHVTISEAIKGTIKAGRVVSQSSFNNTVAQFCAKLGVAAPPVNVIREYQGAVVDLARCLSAFSKLELDKLKTIGSNLTARPVRVTTQDKDDIAVAIGRAMGWGGNRQIVLNNFKNQIFDHTSNFKSYILSSLTIRTQLKQLKNLLREYKSEFCPINLASLIHDILN